MATAFEAALQARAKRLGEKLGEVKAPPEDLTCKVRVLLATNELEVWFNKHPGNHWAGVLGQAGFHANGSSWFAPDTQERRIFCREALSAKDLELLPEPVAPAPEPEIKIVVRDTPPDNTPFGIYKRQVDELCAELKMEPTDMFLFAIDALHKATFSIN